MKQSTRYAQRLSGEVHERSRVSEDPGSDSPFQFVVTLGEMDMEDAFRVTLPSSFAQLTVGRFLAQVFPGDQESQARVRRHFDLKGNPDVPEMYDALVGVFGDWRGGRCTLRFFLNHGPEMELSDQVSDHLRQAPVNAAAGPGAQVLNLVVEQHYQPLDYAVEKGYATTKSELLEWLRAHTLLYFFGKSALNLRAEPEAETDRQMLRTAERLHGGGMLELSEEDLFRISERGKKRLMDLIAEAETYVGRYGVFKDVVYDLESRLVEFETGRGEDLRVQVYEAEGLDPVRVVFLLMLYEGTLRRLARDGRWDLRDEAFFAGLLRPVVDRDRADETAIERIIESGFAYLDDRAERTARASKQRDILNRVTAE